MTSHLSAMATTNSVVVTGELMNPESDATTWNGTSVALEPSKMPRMKVRLRAVFKIRSRYVRGSTDRNGQGCPLTSITSPYTLSVSSPTQVRLPDEVYCFALRAKTTS